MRYNWQNSTLRTKFFSTLYSLLGRNRGLDKERAKRFQTLTENLSPHKILKRFYDSYSFDPADFEKIDTIKIVTEVGKDLFGKTLDYYLRDSRVAFPIQFTFERSNDTSNLIRNLSLGSRTRREFGRFVFYFDGQGTYSGPILAGTTRGISTRKDRDLGGVLQKIAKKSILNARGEPFLIENLTKIEFIHNHPEAWMAVGSSPLIGEFWIGNMGLTWEDFTSQIVENELGYFNSPEEPLQKIVLIERSSENLVKMRYLALVQISGCALL